MSTEVTAAVVGAIVGVILGVALSAITDWAKRVRDNKRNLRALRLELQWTRAYRKRYGRPVDQIISDGQRIRPPRVSPLFHQTVAAIDFGMTDEFANDNSYLFILGIADDCAALNEIRERIDLLDDERPRNTLTPLQYGWALEKQVRDYDLAHARLSNNLDYSLENLDHRLAQAGWWSQLARPFRRLPVAVNVPAPTPRTSLE